MNEKPRVGFIGIDIEQSRKEIFGDEALTGALLDRLTHRCHIIDMNGDSYRFKENLKRREESMN